MDKYAQEKALAGAMVEAAINAIRAEHPGAEVHTVTEYGTGRLKGFMVFTDAGTLGVNMEISPWTPDPQALAQVKFQG